MSQLQPNFFQFPNVIADELMRHMTANQFVCLVTIIRKTRGWHKASDSISLSQFMEATGIRSKHTVMRALKVLENVGLVAVGRTLRVTTVYTLGAVFYSKNCTRGAIAKIALDLGAQNTPVSHLPSAINAHTKESTLNIKEKEKRGKPAQVKSEKEKRADGAQLKPGHASATDPTKNGTRSTDGINPEMADIFKQLSEACKP